MPGPATYCERQMVAVLTVCARCARAYYMTKPEPVCVACRTHIGRRLIAARIIPAGIILAMIACAQPYQFDTPHPTKAQIMALAEAGPARELPGEAEFSLRFGPAHLMEGGSTWMTCYVPPSLKARVVRLELPGVFVRERPEHLHFPKLVERVPCGAFVGTCTVRDATGRVHTRSADLRALGRCDG